MATTQIKDEFSDLKISRQARWQLRQKAKGGCILCGKPQDEHTSFCAYHRKWKAKYQRLQNQIKKKANGK
jgi:hypothetical protein